MAIKKIKQIPPAFTVHKVTIKAITTWNGHMYTFLSPCNAIDYLCEQGEGVITIIKQRESSIKIMLECTDSVYELLKLNFVRIMGDKFIWKD